MSKTATATEVLLHARDFLGVYENWCPQGPRGGGLDGRIQKCVFESLADARETLLGIANYDFINGYCRDVDYLMSAAIEKLGLPKPVSVCEIISYNDGRYRYSGLPLKERWETLLAILDRAIELSKVAENKGEKPAGGVS